MLTRLQAACWCANNVTEWNNKLFEDGNSPIGWNWMLIGEKITLNKEGELPLTQREWMMACKDDLCRPGSDSESVFK